MSAYSPLVFSVEQIESLAESICSTQLDIVCKGQGLDTKSITAQGKTEAVLYAIFGMSYGLTPQDRKDYSDIFDQIADFASHLAKDHPFPDANKRTTVLTSISLLYRAGIIINVNDSLSTVDNVLYQWIQKIVEGKLELSELAQELRKRAVLLPSQTRPSE